MTNSDDPKKPLKFPPLEKLEKAPTRQTTETWALTPGSSGGLVQAPSKEMNAWAQKAEQAKPRLEQALKDKTGPDRNQSGKLTRTKRFNDKSKGEDFEL